MYRFLDKRFYNTPRLSLDLIEFACGHVGLTESDNVAILKRRLAPAIAELEEIGFLEPLTPEERFQKVKAGVWRVLFARCVVGGNREQGTGDSSTLPVGVPSAVACPPSSVPLELATEYYRLWDPILPAQPGPRDLEQAQALLHDHGTEAKALIACLVRVTKKRWPDCRSLSGAVQKYLPEAVEAASAGTAARGSP